MSIMPAETHSKAGAQKPSAAELVGRAEKIAVLAREQALETEQNRCVSPELIAVMREAGLFRIMQPEAFDGFEYGYDVFVDCVAAISAGDGSTGWVYSLGAVHPWMFAGLPLEAQHEIWDDQSRRDRRGVLCADRQGRSSRRRLPRQRPLELCLGLR